MLDLRQRRSAAAVAGVGSLVAVAPLVWGRWADEQVAHDIRVSAALTLIVMVSGVVPFLFLAWLLDRGEMPPVVGLGAGALLSLFVVLTQYSGFVDSSSTAVAAFPLGGVAGVILVGVALAVFRAIKASRASHRRDRG